MHKHSSQICDGAAVSYPCAYYFGGKIFHSNEDVKIQQKEIGSCKVFNWTCTGRFFFIFFMVVKKAENFPCLDELMPKDFRTYLTINYDNIY